MTLKSKVPFYDGLLPGEEYIAETKENLFRRSLKLFARLRIVLLNKLSKPRNYGKICNFDYGSTKDPRKPRLCKNLFHPKPFAIANR